MRPQRRHSARHGTDRGGREHRGGWRWLFLAAAAVTALVALGYTAGPDPTAVAPRPEVAAVDPGTATRPAEAAQSRPEAGAPAPTHGAPAERDAAPSDTTAAVTVVTGTSPGAALPDGTASTGMPTTPPPAGSPAEPVAAAPQVAPCEEDGFDYARYGDGTTVWWRP